MKIKKQGVIDECQRIISQCREACNRLGYALTDMRVEELAENIRNYLSGGDGFQLDFIWFAREKAAGMSRGGGDGVRCGH
jgi:hypothetical protein